MIQRKQSLFLLQLAFLSLSLLFVPVQLIKTEVNPIPVSLVPVNEAAYASTGGHLAAIALNAVGLILAFMTIFLYRKRELQIKLCYALAAIYVILPLMMALCPFVGSASTTPPEIEKNFFGYIISAVAVISALLAARFIKKDIELLKSADRIR
jgi:hypothetical protein